MGEKMKKKKKIVIEESVTHEESTYISKLKVSTEQHANSHSTHTQATIQCTCRRWHTWQCNLVTAFHN
jgi:hypothetical protein